MQQVTKTFIWKNFITWHGEIEKIIPQVICKDLIERIRKCRDKFKYVDELDLFKKIYSKFGEYADLENDFTTNFPVRFNNIRMYHCCRPTDISSYYSKGICVLDSNEANRKFKDLFLNNSLFPKITESHIEKAISNMTDSYKRSGYVYFGIDDRYLVKYCSHYLVYGSEYLQGLAGFLGRELKCDAKSELKKVGKPIVFVVDIPVEEISKGELRVLATDIFPAWAFAIAHNREDTGMVDFAIDIDQGLKPDRIVTHYIPDLHSD